jgi:peptidoglycan hydrolase-like protein with peptidoglycan-binding domain
VTVSGPRANRTDKHQAERPALTVTPIASPGADAGVQAPFVDPGLASPDSLPPAVIFRLQRSAGNAAVQDLMARRSREGLAHGSRVGDRPTRVAQRDDAPGATPATAAPAPAATRPVLSPGDGPSSEVGQLQQALNALGSAIPPLRITGVYGPETTAAVTAFQLAHPPLLPDGIAGVPTWAKIDELAPRVSRQGRSVVEGPAEGEPRGTPLGGSIHPTVRRSSTGPAVEELQQKLNTIPPDQVPTLLEVDGKFGAITRQAVREFQASRTPPLADDGVAGPLTWTALDAVAGGVTVGRESFDWEQRAEGTITGGPTRFTWRLLPDRLQVTVNIRFTGAPGHPRVAQWRGDITSVWNHFAFQDEDNPGTLLPLEFVVGSGTPADATVAVIVTPPPPAVPGRSDSANWHTGDTDPGLAPHEFGHLIGLRDEYNQAPEQYAAVTGEQAPIGQLGAPLDASGNPVDPLTIAAEMRTAVTSSPASGRGAAARAVVTRHSLRQGAYAQRVALAYETANAGNMLREDFGPSGYVIVNDPAGTMGNDIAARIPGQFDAAGNEAVAVAPFLYDNRGIMGSMASLNSPIGAHDHPVAERHVRHFRDIVRRNRPGTWRTVRT